MPVNIRRLATSSSGSSGSGETKEELIAKYPNPWPWGQTIEVDTGKQKLTIKIPQDRPAPRQHKLIYKVDPSPPEVPPAPSYFVGPVGKMTHSLFNAALKADTLDVVKESIDKFVAIFESQRDIKNAILNPRLSGDDKLKYVQDVAASIGVDELTANLVTQLQKDKRLGKIGEILRNFGVLLSEHRKELFGAVISAEPLSETHYAQIFERMKKMVKPDEKLIVAREVDPSLVGGFIVRIGNRAQDLSVATQIARMETHLRDFFAKNQQAVDKVLA